MASKTCDGDTYGVRAFFLNPFSGQLFCVPSLLRAASVDPLYGSTVPVCNRLLVVHSSVILDALLIDLSGQI